MSVNNFNPTWWANEVTMSLKKELVLSNEPIINKNYEGEFSEAGDSVKITQIGAVTSKTYAGTVVYEEMSDAQLVLVIDQEQYFGVKYKDLDKAQNMPKLSASIAEEGAYALNDSLDQAVAEEFTNAGIKDSTIGVVGTSVAVTSSTAETYFTNCYRLMSEANVPKAGRWFAVPPWITQRINQQLISTMTENTDEVRNGFVGRAWGFDFYETNNLENDSTDWNLGFGRQPAITLAEQIAMVEAMRDQDGFNDLIRGYHVYGLKTVRPDQLGLGVVKKS